MTKIVFSNFAAATLAAPIGTTDTSLTVASGKGALFPSPTGDEYCILVLTDDATKEVHEVIWVTARAGDTMTIERGKEGTTAKSWLVGDICQLTVTKGTLEALYQEYQFDDGIVTLVQNTMWPIGSEYVSYTTTDNPATILGFGTWAAVPGRVGVGYDASQTEFNALLKTGGEKTHTLTVAEVPALEIDDKVLVGNVASATNGFTTGAVFSGVNNAITAGLTHTTGGGGSHNNLQPYIVKAVWRRTA